MTTYSTYQEAKIANPEEEILKARDDWDGCKCYVGKFIANKPDESGGVPFIGKGSFKKCDPSKYCITVEKFLADGHKVFMGDVIINANGNVNNITQGCASMLNGEGGAKFNDTRYILHAAALEKPFLQTGEGFEHSKNLNFIRNRLIDVHGEPNNLDYMHKLNNAIAFVERMEEPSNLGGSGTGKEEKPRCAKVFYEKLSFEYAWHAIKAFEDGEKLYTKQSSEEFVLIDNAPDVLRYLYDLHERVETEITEREEFIDEVCAINEKTHGERRQYLVESLFDSGRVKLIN